MNVALLSDSYKFTHWVQYPPGTTKVYSYFESRGGKFQEVVFFGLQYILQQYLAGEFRISATDVKEAEDLCALHFGRPDLFNREGWRHIVQDHHGKLPLQIKAVPEGTVVPVHNVLMTVENTCPRCFWVTNFFETLLVQTWYPTTVATLSRAIKQDILNFLKKTGDQSLIDFKLHDFGFRGVSSVESAGIGGAAHLVNFLGTDTLRGITMLRDHYSNPCAGHSIPASEHSTMTSWGREHEVDAMRNMLEKFPNGFVSCVSDSFDIRAACSELWGGQLKDKVLERDGVLVVRPDSGQPIAEIVLDVIGRLGQAFGLTWNSKGYRVLNPKIRVIQGDGVNFDSIHDVLDTLAKHAWSADNIAFGMGGALLQKLDRDTQRMAFKCSYVQGVDESMSPAVYWGRDVYKDPVTDPGKVSQRGRLSLIKVNGSFKTQPQSMTRPEDDILQEVFLNGVITKTWTLKDVRERAAL